MDQIRQGNESMEKFKLASNEVIFHTFGKSSICASHELLIHIYSYFALCSNVGLWDEAAC